MPQKVLKFTGINRKVNEYQNSGACEELINLRPEVGGGYRVIREKDIYKTGVSYDMIYEHSFGNTTNLVVSTNGVVWWLKDKNNLGEITSDFAQKGGVSISSAGNVLVVYCKEEDRQLAFKFENEEYVSYDFAPKQITNVEIAYAAGTTYYTAVADDSSAGALNAALQKAASGFNQTYPNGLCGYSIVGCSYELEDGQELWSTAFVVANGEITSGYQQPSINAEAKTAQVSGARKIYLCLSFADMPYSGIRKINVYATRPVFPYFVENTMSTSFKISKQSLEEMDLGGQIMYYQGSIDPRETSARLLLKFNSEQAGEDIMKVMSGCIYRTGQMVSYNNRFHFYDSTAKHTLQLPSVSRDSQLFTIMGSNSPEVFKDAVENDNGDIAPYWIAYVKINNEWKLIDKVYRFFETDINDFIYPMAGVKQLVFVKAAMTGSTLSVPYEEMFYVDLKDSAAYNYSHAFNVTPSIVSATDFHSDMQAAGQIWGNGFDTSVTWKKEENAVNVSSPFNPFVFPVEYSYSFGGEIRDITTAYLPISSTQAGQYPLIVFTSNGIYALEQGNGTVLYGNVVPLQPQVINGRAKATPYGTFFVSSKNLYLLSGRDAVDVSRPLIGKPESTPKALNTYKALCCSSANDLYDFTNALSQFNFESIISDVSLVYDQLQNELYISSNNESVKYSYVLNLATRLFHKVPFKFKGSRTSSRYALRLTNQTDVVDLFEELDTAYQPILLQSRPMSLEVFYTHIQRIMMLIDTAVVDEQYLFLSVFGSNNLSDWDCIISSQKRDVVLRQIRTNKAARSYKDYVILINGAVPTDTNISDIIADYTVVQRRLG
jgi:hypothetical protein